MTQTLAKRQESQETERSLCGGIRGRLIFRLKRRLTENEAEAFKKLVKAKTDIEVKITYPHPSFGNYCCLSLSEQSTAEEAEVAREKIRNIRNLPCKKEELEVAS